MAENMSGTRTEEIWLWERAVEIQELLYKAEQVCKVANPLGYSTGVLGPFRRAERHISAAILTLEEETGSG